jgi:hypothetical protein
MLLVVPTSKCLLDLAIKALLPTQKQRCLSIPVGMPPQHTKGQRSAR